MKSWHPLTSASANSLQLLSSVSTSTVLFKMLRLSMDLSCSVLSMHRFHSSSNLRVEIKQLIKASSLKGWGPCNKQTKNNPHKNKLQKLRIFLYSSQIPFQIFQNGNLRLKILLFKTRKFKPCTTFQINWEKEHSARLFWGYRKTSNHREMRNEKQDLSVLLVHSQTIEIKVLA